jgi:protein-L-isoaspartate(D-aspartate) O-methyltransferase
MEDHASERLRMVETQLRRRGIHDERVLAAMAEVPREAFVPASRDHDAYDDGALPIGGGQTISQPYMVARATELLRLQPGDTVLEIGLGSGYQAAVLAKLARRVIAIERVDALTQKARAALAQVGAEVEAHTGDGSTGYAPGAPYDAILVSAGGPRVPSELIAQLAPGGRLVMPVGEAQRQVLTLVERTPQGVATCEHDACVYVPLLGAAGFPG